MKKSLIALMVCGIGLTCMAANEAKFPASWGKYGKSEVTNGANGVIKVASQGNSGFCGSVKVTPNRRYTFSFEARGEGKLQFGVHGSFGWCYSETAVLKKDAWTRLSIDHGTITKDLILAVYSRVGTPTTYEVRNLKAVPAEAVELEDAEIAPKLFLAADVPGPLCKKRENVKGAANGKAVWGKIWYQLNKLPVPANKRGIFYYVRAQKSADKPFALHFFNAAYRFPVSAGVKINAANSWEWVKIGPLNAALGAPSVILTATGDGSVEVLVDKIVISTKADLTAAALDKIQK